jgi:uncharacterized protein (TIGR00369 family)
VSAAPESPHFLCLESLFENAPVSRLYGARAIVREGSATVSFRTRPEFMHAAGGVHGSAYFRMLDDAAFFAANSREHDYLLATLQFSVQFLRPCRGGTLTATGTLTHQSGRIFFAQAELRGEHDQLLATGAGIFTRSGVPLSGEIGYR